MKLKLFFLFFLIILIPSCSSEPEEFVILCAGDSITASDYPGFLKDLLDKDGIETKVLNYGRSGNTSGDWLRFLRKNKDALAQREPDFILLQLGTNDVRIGKDKAGGDIFYRNMKEIIKIFKTFRNKKGRKTRILLAKIPPVPLGSFARFSKDSSLKVTSEINPLIERLAKEEKHILVDNYTLFLGKPHLLPEIHPSREGYRAMAENWYKHLHRLLD